MLIIGKTLLIEKEKENQDEIYVQTPRISNSNLWFVKINLFLSCVWGREKRRGNLLEKREAGR